MASLPEKGGLLVLGMEVSIYDNTTVTPLEVKN
jgi:hypothetical protein